MTTLASPYKPSGREDESRFWWVAGNCNYDVFLASLQSHQGTSTKLTLQITNFLSECRCATYFQSAS